MIPKILHFVWIGSDPLPAWGTRNLKEFIRLNPDHEVVIHGEEALMPDLEKSYSLAVDNASKADLIRYSALATQGGWYFDLDFWPLRPVEDAERAWALDGSKLFLSRCKNNVNPAMGYANGVLACAPANKAVLALIRRAACLDPLSRNTYGPVLVEAVAKAMPRDVIVSDGAWWFPVNAEEAVAGYPHMTAGDEGRLAIKPGTGGQRPFAVHLWAGATAGRLVVGSERWSAGCAPLAVVATAPTDQHPLSALARGLERAGYRVVRAAYPEEVANEWALPEVVAYWNGRKDRRFPEYADACGAKHVCLEHGFFERGEYSQAASAGFLHWASWAENINDEPPAEARQRLDRVAPDRCPVMARPGYILTLGQLSMDSQMDESEIKGAAVLQQYVARNLPHGTKAYFRPHPLDNYSPHPLHETLPLMTLAKESNSYRHTKHGSGLAEALAGASFVITINSNSIVEALCAGVPCLAFGPHLGIKANVVKKATVATLAEDIKAMLDGWAPAQDDVDRFLSWLAFRQYSRAELSTADVVNGILEASGEG